MRRPGRAPGLSAAIQVACVASALLARSACALRSLPRTVIGGYSSWGFCNETTMLSEARDGVNVIWWFASNLNPSGINPPVDLDCVANVSRALREAGLPTLHIHSIGGWDAPHPQNYSDAGEMYAQWKAWNTGVVARPGLETGFDGVDWDLEGNDAMSSEWNAMSVKTLDLVGGFSTLAKRDGYLVTLVPCESYLDPSTPLFSRNLTFAYPDGWQPNFLYHGRNNYAYLVSRYGLSYLPDGQPVPTFDAVTIQLYESYSHADYNTSVLKQSPVD
jgi:hypothetical protein